MKRIKSPLFFFFIVLFLDMNALGQDSLLLTGVPTWHQFWPYNMYCPVDTSDVRSNYPRHGHCLAGCGSVAVSQILRYYHYPDSGRGSVSYTTTLRQPLSMNFDTCAFDWQNMPMTLDSTSPETEQRSVAYLLYAVGLMLKTDFAPNASGADMDLFIKEGPSRLNYSGNIGCFNGDKISGSIQDSIVIKELKMKRPVIYKAESDSAAHIFVIDGYAMRKNRPSFRVNPGNGLPGVYCHLDSVYLFDELYYKKRWILTHFAPASLPAPENLRYSLEGRYLYIRWNPVQDTNVCGYHLHMWKDNEKSATIWGCRSNQTEMLYLDNKDTAIMNSMFPDSVEAMTFKVVAIHRDSTGSTFSQALTLPRDKCFPALAGYGINPAADHTNFSCRFTRDDIRLIFPSKESIRPREAALFRINGTLIKSIALSEQASQQCITIPFERSSAVSSYMVLRIRMSDNSTIAQPIVYGAFHGSATRKY